MIRLKLCELPHPQGDVASLQEVWYLTFDLINILSIKCFFRNIECTHIHNKISPL